MPEQTPEATTADRADERDLAAEGRDDAAEARDLASDLASDGALGQDSTAGDRRLASEDRAAAARDRRDDASRADAATARDDAAQVRDARSTSARRMQQTAADRAVAALDRHAEALRVAAASARDIALELRDAMSSAPDDAGDDLRDDLFATADRLTAALDRQEAATRASVATARDQAAEVRDVAAALAEDGDQAHGDRVLAAGDRAAAALDRQEAARDRDGAADDLENAYRDDLTGALVRDAGWDLLRQAVARAHRTEESLVIAFLDVDHLKQVNDVHGHGAGDRVLEAAGAALRQGLRSYDVVVRYGGDEFVCGLPDASIEEAGRRFDDVSAMLTAAVGGATVSVGLAQLWPTESVAEVIDRADQEMYEGRRVRRGTAYGSGRA